MDPDTLFGGWGVKTMSKVDGGYNPIEYPNGTVWPHDNSLMAHGPRRYGYGIQTARVASVILETAPYFGYRGSSPVTAG